MHKKQFVFCHHHPVEKLFHHCFAILFPRLLLYVLCGNEQINVLSSRLSFEGMISVMNENIKNLVASIKGIIPETAEENGIGIPTVLYLITGCFLDCCYRAASV